jgi:hypothetical protein
VGRPVGPRSRPTRGAGAVTSDAGAAVFGDRVVIVLGQARSGTTWLVQLLAGHPDLAGLSWESTIFFGLWDLWENAHRADGHGISAYMTADDVARAMRAFCDRTFSVTADGRDAARPLWFIEKTPDNVNRLPLIAATYPDARYIHLLRDGRDVARSQVVAPWGTDDPGEAARNWVWAVRQVQRQRWRLGAYREIRYEQLVEDPVAEATALLEWLGLPVDGDVTRLIEERVPEEVARYGATDRLGPGKWQQLSETQLAAVYEVAAPLLTELGYLDGSD